MRKPVYGPKYIPETREWWYQGKYYDENPEGRYQEDLDAWAADHEDDRKDDR